MSTFSIEDLERELEDRKAAEAKSRRTPWYRFVAEVLIAAVVCTIVLVNQTQIREYYFPTPIVTTNDLSVDDVNNEEQIIRDLEDKYQWLWIMEVHRMSTGTVSVLSGVHPDRQPEISNLSAETWSAISLQATKDIIIAFSPAARNGNVYMRYVRTSNFTMVGVLQCDTKGSADTMKWQCLGARVEPPLPIQPDFIEYQDRVIVLPTLPTQ